jgi:Lrp/AsnC family leucine-responsive transcriptional regulator/Lrp/AsnC family transcriptional regulator
MIKLDQTDRHILELLQMNSRMTIKEMAVVLQLSSTPVFERIKKLERVGIIKGYVALVDAKRLGKKVNAFVHVSMKSHDDVAVQAFEEAIQAFPEIMECHHVSGHHDFLLKVLLDDMEHYHQFLRHQLSTLPNIEKTETLFSLSVRKATTAIPI